MGNYFGCVCSDYDQNAALIDGIKAFKYCPWCGLELREYYEGEREKFKANNAERKLLFAVANIHDYFKGLKNYTGVKRVYLIDDTTTIKFELDSSVFLGPIMKYLEKHVDKQMSHLEYKWDFSCPLGHERMNKKEEKEYIEYISSSNLTIRT